MILKLRHSNNEPGYWFEIIRDTGQILAQSGVFATREAIDGVMATIQAEAADAVLDDRSLD